MLLFRMSAYSLCIQTELSPWRQERAIVAPTELIPNKRFTLKFGAREEWSLSVAEWLIGGICVQRHDANRQGHALGYASVNGGEVIGKGKVDLSLAKDAATSLEIFFDGYLSLPTGTDVTDWEAEFARVEAADFHQLSDYPSVQGSMTGEFSDDGTVICLIRGDRYSVAVGLPPGCEKSHN